MRPSVSPDRSRFAGMASLISISDKLEPLGLRIGRNGGGRSRLRLLQETWSDNSCLAMFASGFLCLVLRRDIEWRMVFAEPADCLCGQNLIIDVRALNLIFSRPLERTGLRRKLRRARLVRTRRGLENEPNLRD